MRLPDTFPWTAENKYKVQIMAADGETTRHIAEKMGTSRNSIIGMCRRNGIKISKNNKGRPSYKIEIDMPVPRRIPYDYCLKYKKKRFVELLDPIPHKTSLPFPTQGFCKSIVGDVRNLRQCSYKEVYGSSWCSEHKKAYFQSSRPYVAK